MKNLGQDGVFLKTALPFPAGRRAHLGWLLPGDVQVQADAEVVWATNSGSATMDPGMGLRFIDIIEGDDILRIYLKKRRLVGE
jgi:Tfp pilus assembly protein PilZ